MSQIGQKHKVSNKCPCQCFVQSTETRSTAIRLVQIGKSSQSSKNQTNSSNTCQFVRNTTQDSINPQKIPLGHDVCWSAVRVCWNVVIRVSLKFRVKIHQISSTQTQPQRSNQVFGVKVRQGSEGGPFQFHKLPSKPYVTVSRHTAFRHILSIQVCTKTFFLV